MSSSKLLKKYREQSVYFLKNKVGKYAQAYEDKMFEEAKGKSIEELYENISYEIIGYIYESHDKKERKNILKDMKNGTYGWESSFFSEYRKRIHDIDYQQIEDIKVEKGEFPCRNKKCRSYQCYIWQEQTRSADEGATTYVMCAVCHNRYRFN